MHLLDSNGLAAALDRRNVFLDTDFLSVITRDEGAFDDFKKLTDGRCVLLLDPFTKFETLRHVYSPGRRAVLEQFLNKDIFTEAVKHPTVFLPILDNALKLSWIYAIKGGKGASPVDVILASRSIYHKALLITGNRKDFPKAVFKLVGTLSYEEGDSTRAFSVLDFNVDGYAQAEKDLALIP